MKHSSLLLILAAVACSPTVTPTSSDFGPPAPASATVAPSSDAPRTGLLVMAHGGNEEWNQSVMDAVRPASELLPTAVAFGMANPYTLQAALNQLGEEGVTRIAVVRMFLSGESFLEQTEYFLGLSPDRPEQFVLMGPAAGDPDARTPLLHSMEVATHGAGILDSHYVSEIVKDRARAISVDPDQEAVVLIAHGMGAEDENDRVLASMRRAAEAVSSLGYAEVEIATLREDWEQKRQSAEEMIRAYVQEQAERERSVLVVPMRLSGFGPYAEVLDGLAYSAGEGLLPHDRIGRWVLDTANDVTCASGWGPIANECPRAIAEAGPSLQGRN